MHRRTKITIIGTAAVAVATVAVGGAVAATGDDDANERPISPEAIDQATEVALEHLGEGRVTGTEEGDEDSYYEVEVTLDDGTEVDVQLDRDFAVVGDETDLPDD